MNDKPRKDVESTGTSTGPHRFRMEGWISCAPFERLLHMEIVEVGEGKATLSMPFLVDFAQGAGLMHGGALVSLADTAVVMAIKSIIPPETHFATVSLKSEFLHPVKQGIITAKAQVLSQVGRSVIGEATVCDETERPVLKFSSACKIARTDFMRGITYEDHQDGSSGES